MLTLRSGVTVLTDEDVAALPQRTAIETMRAALRRHAQGELVSPPRHTEPLPGGSMTFTVGGDAFYAGFRTQARLKQRNRDEPEPNVTALWSDGTLRAVVIDCRLAPLRTGAIGGVAIDALARSDTRRVGLIGAGRQAAAQLRAAATVRNVASVAVASRNAERREAFASAAEREIGVPVRAVDGPGEAVAGADLVIVATSSREPVIEGSWLEPGMHVSALGPKFSGQSELTVDAFAASHVLATDAPEQIHALAERAPLVCEDHQSRLIPLGRVLTDEAGGRRSRDDVTFFWSAGLAGTESALADAVLGHAQQ